jgi:tetratricopeptide (TPR) repeat protein
MADFELSKKEATRLIENGEYATALELFRDLERLAPNSEERAAIFVGECHCLEALGMFEKARECLREVAKLGESTPAELAYMAYLEARLEGDEGKNTSAVARLDRLLEEQKELLHSAECEDLYESIQMQRLEYLVNVGRMQEARPLFSEARGFSMEKRYDFAFREAYCLAKCGDLAEAHQIMSKALAESNGIFQETRGRYYLGAIYVADRKYNEALVEFQFCETHVGESSLSYSHVMDALAYVHEELGHAEEAIRYKQAAAGTKFEQ